MAKWTVSVGLVILHTDQAGPYPKIAELSAIHSLSSTLAVPSREFWNLINVNGENIWKNVERHSLAPNIGGYTPLLITDHLSKVITNIEHGDEIIAANGLKTREVYT